MRAMSKMSSSIICKTTECYLLFYYNICLSFQVICSMSDLKPGHYSAIRFLQCNTLSNSHVCVFFLYGKLTP